MKRWLWMGLAIAGAAVLASTEVWAGAGVSGPQILQEQFGAQPAGMGGAFVAFSGQINAFEYNPAGLFNLKKTEVLFMHASGFEGLSAELVAAMMPISGLGVAGLQYLYRGQPNINNDVPDESPIEVKEMLYGLSFAREAVKDLSLGLNARLTALTLGPVNTGTLSLDLGFQYVGSPQLTVGAAIRNLGQEVKYNTVSDPLPLVYAVGAKYTIIAEGPHTLTAGLDVDYLAPEANLTLHGGGEYWFRQVMALRMGYSHSFNQSVKGFAGGMGFRFTANQRVDILLDYALLPEAWEINDFEFENRFTLSVRF